MDRVAVAAWKANGGFFSFNWDEGLLPSDADHYEQDDFDRLMAKEDDQDDDQDE